VGAPFDPASDYPLGERRPDLVETPDGTPFGALTLDAVVAGTVAPGELRASSATLARQAAVALAAGRPQLAENLVRASELASVPDDVILAVYTALRPHRSTADELERWARRLEEEHDAPVTAAFVREAIGVYVVRNLLLSGADEHAAVPA